jgi:hypothetical protein
MTAMRFAGSHVERSPQAAEAASAAHARWRVTPKACVPHDAKPPQAAPAIEASTR